jgi:hypothetical protein
MSKLAVELPVLVTVPWASVAMTWSWYLVIVATAGTGLAIVADDVTLVWETATRPSKPMNQTAVWPASTSNAV